MHSVARVLVVEDDLRVVIAVSSLLRQRDHRVESVPNGESARQALRRGNFPTVEVREGSMGRVMPGWDVQILDEDERPVPVGERGRVLT